VVVGRWPGVGFGGWFLSIHSIDFKALVSFRVISWIVLFCIGAIRSTDSPESSRKNTAPPRQQANCLCKIAIFANETNCRQFRGKYAC
jgi:hypothetical protein